MNLRYMSGKNPRIKRLPEGLLYIGEREGKIVRILLILVMFKSDENNILQQAIHLFSNRRIYYLLFD